MANREALFGRMDFYHPHDEHSTWRGQDDERRAVREYPELPSLE
jgi:hypothetical protein